MAKRPSQRGEDPNSIDQFPPEPRTLQARLTGLKLFVYWLFDAWSAAGRRRRRYIRIAVALVSVGLVWLVWLGIHPSKPKRIVVDPVASADVERLPIFPPEIGQRPPSRPAVDRAASVDRNTEPIETPKSVAVTASPKKAGNPSPLAMPNFDPSQFSPPMPRPAAPARIVSLPEPAREEAAPAAPAVLAEPEPAPTAATAKSPGGFTTWGSTSAPVGNPEHAAIQDLLGRYRTAYSALDAAGVRQVWPSVNQRSLERAFRQLASQDVSFFSCEIDMEREHAGATCVGSTDFVPRVGNRSQSGPSQWNFKLSKTSAGPWLIDDVQVR